MAWKDSTPYDLSDIQIIQQPVRQPVTVFQQLPAMASPLSPPRTGGIREDLVELMMMQNAQMHQVIMNNMTMSALSSFGYTHTPEHTAEFEEREDDPEVYHHHYPYSPYSAWGIVTPPQHFLQTLQEPPHPSQPVHREHRDRRAVPPPPPPSATGTVGADIPPAAEYYDTERNQ